MKRTCGGCTLCCKLLPLVELNKPANTRCQHQRTGHGCRVYADRPLPCRLWSCGWLASADAGNLQRPDRVHYVVDCIPDFVTWETPEGSRQIPVLQIWVDPDYPEAYQDPALLAFIEKQEGMAALIRLGSRDGFTIWPPAISPSGEWMKIISNCGFAGQHSAKEIGEVMRGRSSPADV